MNLRFWRLPAAAHVVLPVGCTAMLAVGAAAAGLHGAFPAPGVVAAVATVAAGGSLSAEPAAAVVLAAVGWLTVAGFSQPPYAQLRLTAPWTVRAAVIIAACSLLATGAGMAARRLTRTFTMRMVVLHEEPGPPAGSDPGRSVAQPAARVAADVIARQDGTDDFLAEAAPGARLALIREKQAQGRMAAMMGDGTSGAPALAQADAGTAMNTGATAKAAGNMPAPAPNPRS
jgi:hypothetical protein